MQIHEEIFCNKKFYSEKIFNFINYKNLKKQNDNDLKLNFSKREFKSHYVMIISRKSIILLSRALTYGHRIIYKNIFK